MRPLPLFATSTHHLLLFVVLLLGHFNSGRSVQRHGEAEAKAGAKGEKETAHIQIHTFRVGPALSFCALVASKVSV